MGRWRDSRSWASASDTLARRRAWSRCRTITARGFASLPFRSRRRCTASSFRASTARWKPPRPRTARIAPCFRSAPATAMPVGPVTRAWCVHCGSASSSHTVGPHCQHEFVSEWNRRSAGSRYSASHSGHWVKAPIDVRVRSYGIDSMTVNRGPQSVQVMKG